MKTQQEKQARQAAYMRRWYRENRNLQALYNARHWTKKAFDYGYSLGQVLTREAVYRA